MVFNAVQLVPECDVPVPGILIFFGDIGKKWYQKKVSEPISEKFGTGTDFFRIFFEFRTIIMGTSTGTGNFSFFLVVSEPVS